MNSKRNMIYVVACTLVYGFLTAAAVGSYSNIVGLAHDLGVSSGHAWTTPLLVDGIALMGKLLRSRHLALSAHRAGLRLMIFGGVLSLIANILHGHTWGDRIYGALLVVGFIVVERASDHLAPAPDPTPAAGKRCEPGCACGKHKPRKARKAPVRRGTPKAPADSAEAARMLAVAGVAPQSPA